MSKWNTYILLCDQKTYYVGLTDNLEKRIEGHKKGYSPYTKRFSDFELVYTEKYEKRYQAEKREQQLKKWSIAKKKALVDGKIDLLRKLSKGT